ncbi:MAG TPA: DUF6069 family protein [Dehalococcoidia bacterium]|nr:DUF6069 family protein [Dehalococcoidia bacterium]
MDSSTRRSLAVIATGIATGVVLWGLFRVSGVDLSLNDSASISSVGVVDVIIAAALAGFAAWGVHSIMLRRGAGRYWPLVGSAALSISIIGPSWLAEGWSVVPLIVMHFAVGWVLIAGFGWLARSDADRACAMEHLPLPLRRLRHGVD